MSSHINKTLKFSIHLVYRDYHYIDRASQASLQCSQGEDYK